MRVLFISGFSKDSYGISSAAVDMRDMLFDIAKERSDLIVDVVDINAGLSENEPINNYDMALASLYPFKLVWNKKLMNDLLRCMSSAKSRLFFTVAETTPLPQSWAPIWQAFDGFVAPSRFLVDQISNESHKPVYELPHLIDINKFLPISVQQKQQETMFTVLFVGQNTLRKGWQDAVVAFARSLGDKPDTRIVIKTHSISNLEPDPDPLSKFLMMTNCQTGGKSLVLNGSMSKSTLDRLYRIASCFLFPSRGEGFGLTPAEAMAFGLPVIYTQGSSLMQVCESHVNLGIPSFLDEAHGMDHYGIDKGLNYSYPLIGPMISHLDTLYALWKRDRKMFYEKSIDNRNIINDRFGREKFRAYFANLLDAHRPKDTPSFQK